MWRLSNKFVHNDIYNNLFFKYYKHTMSRNWIVSDCISKNSTNFPYEGRTACVCSYFMHIVRKYCNPSSIPTLTRTVVRAENHVPCDASDVGPMSTVDDDAQRQRFSGLCCYAQPPSERINRMKYAARSYKGSRPNAANVLRDAAAAAAADVTTIVQRLVVCCGNANTTTRPQ